MLFRTKIKGRVLLPLILLFISFFISQPIMADDLTMKSVGRVNLEELTASHPLSARISRLEERIDSYKEQHLKEERLLNLEDEILARIRIFSEQSYNRSEFIVNNYNKQIERREAIAETEKENLQQELEKEQSNKLTEKKEKKQEEINRAIKEKERYYTAELKSDKQEVIRDYNREISRLKLAIRFSDLSAEQMGQKTERLDELKAAKESEIKEVEQEYEKNLAEYSKNREAEITDYKKEYGAELEEVYEQKYEEKVEEIVASKEKDIALLEEELADKLTDKLVEIEAKIDDEIFADEIINRIKEKDKQSLQRLESLKEKLAKLEDERKKEISQLIDKYKAKYNLDLVISNQLPRVSAQDLTTKIKSEWSVASE